MDFDSSSHPLSQKTNLSNRSWSMRTRQLWFLAGKLAGFWVREWPWPLRRKRELSWACWIYTTIGCLAAKAANWMGGVFGGAKAVNRWAVDAGRGRFSIRVWGCFMMGNLWNDDIIIYITCFIWTISQELETVWPVVAEKQWHGWDMAGM
jgi:hypothetical protein